MKIVDMTNDVARYMTNASQVVAAKMDATEAFVKGDYREALDKNNLCYELVFDNYQILRKWGWKTEDERETLDLLLEKVCWLSSQLNLGS